MNGVERRTRRDPLGDATRDALLEKAEAMFAEKGVDGVSLRQIGIAIGSSNANVVGYHFGTKEALVEAVLLRNRPLIEMQRAELLAKARREGQESDIPTLLAALCRPVFERRNKEGLHKYALFLWQISRSNWWALPAYETSIRATQDILKRIATAVPDVPDKYLLERLQAVADIFSGVLQRLDQNSADNRTQERMYSHALHMANAIVTMPFGQLDDEPECTTARNDTIALGDRHAPPLFGEPAGG
jgi:AcrR family transcriptional regulator